MSRLYGAKTFERAMERRMRATSESRDAIVWDVDASNYLVRCKIQGSNEYILCHYPRNWQTLPPWLKRGNAVRIAHRGGIRGNLEVVGHGRAIPTPVSGDQFPSPQCQPDGVITGGNVYAYSGMTVEVEDTTYRIDCDTYELDMGGC